MGTTVLPRVEPETAPRPPRHPDGRHRHRRDPQRSPRRVAMALLAVAALGVICVLWARHGVRGDPTASAPRAAHGAPRAPRGDPRLDADWDGDGAPVTFAFGGDVNFPVGSVLFDRLEQDPRTALGPGVPALLRGANLSMVNFESALTNGSCPAPQPKTYVFWAPPSSLSAFRAAGVSLVSEANNHGQDCGEAGLQMALRYRAEAHYTVLGIGTDAKAAFASYQTVIDGEHIGIIAATQVIDDDLVDAWTATPTHAGLASAYEVDRLVDEVQAARRIDDTVIVFLHWGIQLDACPDPIQEPLATVLVRAGADIVIGSHAHVLLGGGYLGTSYVDYGLGNFAFYNDPAPTDESGSLVITATGRHIDRVSWRPALIQDELPIPLHGQAAAAATQRWEAARSCTDLTAHPSSALASVTSETHPAPTAVVRALSG